MSKLSRRETLTRGGQVAAAAAMISVIPTIAFGAGNDTALVRMGEEAFRLIGEINAGLHSPDGDISDEAWDRRCDLVDTIAETPAHGLEGVAVKLRMAEYQIGVIAGESDTTEHSCVLSALETVKQLIGRRI